MDIQELRKKSVMLLNELTNTSKLSAKDAMIKPVFLYEDDSTDKIIKKLKREDTRVCVVVTKDKRFIGEISDEDIIKLFLHQVKYEPLTKMLNRGYRREFLYKKAGGLINQHKSTINLDTPINKVIELMCEWGFHCIPVLDKKKRVKGVVTPSSILNLLERY
jgi:CBS domain-containing protein